MKKELVILFFILVFSNLVFADCSDDQLIMRLQNPTNSLVSEWDGRTEISGGPPDCPQGLISYWTFDDLNLQDFKGTNHLSVIPAGSSAKYSSGKINNAIGIKDKEYYLEVADNPTLDITGSLTMEAWVYMEKWESPLSLGKMYILTKNGASDSYDDYAMFFHANDVRCRVDKESGADQTLSVSMSSLGIKDTSGWHHLACVYDKSAGKLKLYLNGVNNVARTKTFSSFSVQTNTDPLYIGKDIQQGTNVVKIDEVALYNTALSDSKILEHFSNSNSYCISTESQIIYFENKICYNEIFGNFYTLQDPHHATCTNPILWLQDSRGSQVSLVSSSTFSIPVCYGDLICEARTSCLANERPLIKINSKTSSTTASLPDGAGTFNLCCRSGAGISLAYWSNLISNTEISTADLNDVVKLNVQGVEFEGKEIEYRIVKNGAPSWNPVNWFPSQVAVFSSEDSRTWEASESGTFYFTANIVGKTDQAISGNLVVSSPENNAIPVIQILKPLNKQIYPLNEPLDFSIKIEDPDSVLDYYLDFGDGDSDLGDSLDAVGGVLNLFHSYSTAGQKNILFNVTGGENLWIQKKISISIPDISLSTRKNILSYIDMPTWKSNGGLEVFETNRAGFDAQSSFGYTASLSSGNTQMTCIMGACPTKTDGCFPCSSTADGCSSGCKINIASAPLNNYLPANFSWTISRIESGTTTSEFLNSSFGFYNFSRILRFGSHLAELEILMDTYSSHNKIKFQTGGCSEDRKIFTDGEGNDYETILEGICGTYDDKCCENGFTCQNDPEHPGMMTCLPKRVDPVIVYCSDYKDKDSCNEDASGVGEEGELEWINFEKCGEEINSYLQNCIGCKWTNKCEFYVDPQYINPSVPEEPDYTCSVSTTSDGNCDSGNDFVNVKSDATLYEDGVATSDLLLMEKYNCVDKFENKIPCPSKANLPFFGFTQFIICLLGIFLIYFLIRKK